MHTITADTPSRDGFRGTIPEFLDWLNDRLQCGGIVVSEPTPAEVGSRTVRNVELITGGHGDDERLLSRVHNGSMFAFRFWAATRRGGSYLYSIPVEHFDSSHKTTWLDIGTDVIMRLHRVRGLRVRTTQGDVYEIEMPYGARLSFSEPDRIIHQPNGLLTVDSIEADGDV